MNIYQGLVPLTFYKLFGSPENQKIVVAFLSDTLELDVISVTLHSADYQKIFASFTPEDWLEPLTMEFSVRLSTKETIDVQLIYWSFYETLPAIARHALTVNQQQVNSPNYQSNQQIRSLYVINFLQFVLFEKDAESFRRIVARTNLGLSSPDNQLNEDDLNMAFFELTKDGQ
ncbi:hypothetical protein I6N95_01660 [Vagococcus sp. BWB3-3]|uniref:Uncharacterized protein n=1 Tax=Vagococcus allomyrinae TaxID=2794353 RepID=A0A940SSX3_9ENTE|nr:hypothetical protein [Vagococcus allomyrinae]MBP1039705.1 hypothetical protein [Vagococcus allomyrinae]